MNKLPLLLAAAALPVAASAQSVINVTETFAADQRTNLNLPDGLQWFSSAGTGTGGANLSYVAGTSLTQNTGTAGRHILGYFTAANTPFTLAQGQTLTISATLTFNNPGALTAADNNFRIGLFNSSGGARVTGDNHGGTSASATFDNYLGYMAGFNLGSGADGTASIRERTTTTGQALISGIGAYTTLGNNSSPGAAFAENVAYGFTFSFTRTEQDHLSITLTSTNNNFSLTRVDQSPSTFAFDTLVFNMSSNTATGFTISSASITAVPEPSAFAALAGLGGLAFAATRRRRR